MDKPVYRVSEILEFQLCPRRWWLKYHRDLKRREKDWSKPTELGTLVHRGYEALYKGESWRAALGVQAFLDKERSHEDSHDKIDANLEMAKIMLEGYEEWLVETGADMGVKVLATEINLRADFGDAIVSGTLDRLVQDDLGRVMVDDAKTCQNFSMGQELDLNHQQKTYAVLARVNGYEAVGVQLTMMRKVKRTSRSKPPFYERVQHFYNRQTLDNHVRHLKALVARMAATEFALRGGVDHHELVQPTPSSECSWRCPFRHACPMFDDGSDVEGYLDQMFVVGSQSPTPEESN